MAELKEVSNRVHGISIRTQSFLPEGATEPVTYKQLVLAVEFNGEEDEIALKLDAKNAKLVLAATPRDDNLFDN